MLKHALMATAITFAAVNAHADPVVLISEGFNDVTQLKGWVQTNLGTPNNTPDATGWGQGDVDKFVAQSGAPSSYISANYNNAAAGGTLSNWLITPMFTTEVEGAVSFWARAEILSPYFDQIAFGLSTGSSDPSSFVMKAATTLSGVWTQYTMNYKAQGAGSMGRFAIQYTGNADDANFIGVDTLTVTAAVPEPTTWALMGVGLLGLGALRRRAAAKR